MTLKIQNLVRILGIVCSKLKNSPKWRLKQNFKRRLVKKFRNIGRRDTDVMENFSLFNTPKHELFQQLLFKNLLMTITENDCKNIGRRHTKTIESSNIFDTPKQNLFKTILENTVCEYTPKVQDFSWKFRPRVSKHTEATLVSK